MRKATWLAGTVIAGAFITVAGGCGTNVSARPDFAGPIKPSPLPPSTTSEPSTPNKTSESDTSSESVPPKNSHDVIAYVGGVKIDRKELADPLLEAYGFNTLMLLVQRDMAKQACAEAGLAVTQSDIDSEWNWTLDRMFADNQGEDRQKLLDQYLAQPKTPGQASTRMEMNIIIATNAYLRKLAEPKMKAELNDDVLHQAFDETYGAQVRVRHIALANPQDALRYRATIQTPGDFAKLAQHVSLDTTSPGGELPPFTLNSTRYPAAFKKAAFALKVGEISEPVAADGAWHLILLEENIQPKAVKFQDVKDSVRQDMQEKAVFAAVAAVRNKLGMQAIEQMKISDPILKAEFDKRLGARESTLKDRDKIRQQMDKERAAAVPATQAAPPPDIAPPPPATRQAPQPAAPAMATPKPPTVQPAKPAAAAPAASAPASASPVKPHAAPASPPAPNPPAPAPAAPNPAAPNPPAPKSTVPAAAPPAAAAVAPPPHGTVAAPATRPATMP